MAAKQYDITIEQGADYARTIRWENPDGSPISLEGYTARMQVRTRNGRLLADIPTDGGSLTINEDDGEVTVAIPGGVSAAWKFPAAYYDLKLISSSGAKSRLVKGILTVDEQVTV